MTILPLVLAASLQGASATQKPSIPASPSLPPTWKSVTTRTGATLSVPIDLGLPSVRTSSRKVVTQESYSPKGWPGCTVEICRKPISKDEDPNDSTAVKLEDVVYREVDPSEDRLSRITFFSLAGWPTVDIEGVRKDDTFFRYRVSRTKNQYVVLDIRGKNPPAKEQLKRIFDSFRLPKEIGLGKFASWGPTPAKVALDETPIEIWAPFTLEPSDELPDFSSENVLPVRYAGEFGYSSFGVIYVDLPESALDRFDEAGLDKFVVSQFGQDDDGSKATFGSVTSSTVNDVPFRSVTYVNDTMEGRVDVALKGTKLCVFYVSVPRGLLGAPDVAKFFSSISIK